MLILVAAVIQEASLYIDHDEESTVINEHQIHNHVRLSLGPSQIFG